MPAPQRSILPTVPGVPVIAAVLIAVACTVVGFVIDARGEGDELTNWFAGAYVTGCVIAVLVVRYRALFTTLVLPPLLLFLAVPLAYQKLSGHASTGMKDVLLNLAIPLVNRFPVMVLATALAVAVGILRVVLHRRADGAGQPAPRRRGERPGGDRSTRGRGTRRAQPAESSRRTRRPQPEIDDPDTVQHLPRVNPRRPPAEAPPRGRGYSRETRSRSAAPRRESFAPRSEELPRTAARGRGAEVPPHPRPNVRYRDREGQPELREVNRHHRRDPDDY
ncbi:hypothetical protein D5S18_13555 [Nocardia panacis]|uniref:DUF6542 domain-containing protein n=1 Tax=Nocardia panacis TaxID=2340916 RepID=A0A3A4KLS3_9NOCA|nr:hypothetical protein D5S18_13555 [Nocardia panacis]